MSLPSQFSKLITASPGTTLLGTGAGETDAIAQVAIPLTNKHALSSCIDYHLRLGQLS